MDVIMSLVAVAALIVLFFFVRKKASQDNVRPDERRDPAATGSTRFHAVSIKVGPNACEAAREMQGRRFLSSAAPRIPLPDCDVMECKCRFAHHEDRRKGDDRRNPWGQGFGTGSTGAYPSEQRKGRDRRRRSVD